MKKERVDIQCNFRRHKCDWERRRKDFENERNLKQKYRVCGMQERK
jgi:hypothetical protein